MNLAHSTMTSGGLQKLAFFDSTFTENKNTDTEH